MTSNKQGASFHVSPQTTQITSEISTNTIWNGNYEQKLSKKKKILSLSMNVSRLLISSLYCTSTFRTLPSGPHNENVRAQCHGNHYQDGEALYGMQD